MPTYFVFSRLALATALVACALPAFAAPAALDKAAVDAQIKAYIAAHGEELIASMGAATQRERNAKIAKLVNANTPTMGPVNAPVTIVEFVDIECPYCHGVQSTLTSLKAKYKGQIRWVYKNLPLEFHRNARPAAYAAMAAHKQGKFWEFMAAVWPQQDKLGDKLFTDTAKSLKLDMKRFEADRASATVKAQVDADLRDAEGMEARGTPFFLINGQPVSGALPLDAFTQVIDAELAKAKK